jgi:hypothetical protein
MSLLVRATLALLTLLLVGAGPVPVAPASAADPWPVDPFVPTATDDPGLLRAWSRWEAKGIDDYVLVVRRSCYCPPEPAVRTVVRDGAVRRVSRGDRRLGPALGYTVDEMYARVRDALAYADRVTVEWTRRGVPRRITIDPQLGVADEETYFAVQLIRR